MTTKRKQALPHFEAEAKERQRESGGDRKSEEYQKSVMEKIPEPIPPARDLAAASVGVNPRYVSDAKRIQQQAPEMVESSCNGE